MVDKEKKMGQLTLTYATQIHAAVVEVDPETGEVEIVDYAAVADCGVSIHPQTVQGQGHGGRGGGAIHSLCAPIQDAPRPAGQAIVYDSCNPPHRVWSMLQDPEATRR